MTFSQDVERYIQRLDELFFSNLKNALVIQSKSGFTQMPATYVTYSRALGGACEHSWRLTLAVCPQMSNNEGQVAYVDVRSDQLVWTLTAHEKEVTGNRFCVASNAFRTWCPVAGASTLGQSAVLMMSNSGFRLPDLLILINYLYLY